jgi:hypothetical protein
MNGSVDLVRQIAPAANDFAVSQQNTETPAAPARAQLRIAIADLASAGAELAAAQEPATRLAAVIAEAAGLEAEVAALRAADDDRLGRWLAAGGNSPRPEPGPATIAAEERLGGLSGDAIAARAALPAAEHSFRVCAERFHGLQRRRDEMVCAAAIGAARGFAEKYRAVLTVALEHEAVLHGLRDELLVRGNRADAEPAALAAAGWVSELIAATRRSAAVRRNPEAGRRLLAALQSDPGAALGLGCAA